MFGENASKLALAEAGNVAKPFDTHGGIGVDGTARCDERFEIHAVAVVVETAHDEGFYYGDGFIIG